MQYRVLILFIIIGTALRAQTDINSLPAKIIASNKDTSRPVLFYISGDGGWNKFSTELLQQFSDKGYPVIGLNAKSYFWERKTPKQTATDVQVLLEKYCKEWKRNKVMLLGYSFGADVMPFVYNNLSADWQKKIKHQVLLSPSSKTDFEVHISEMLGYRKKNGMSVVAEINKINSCSLLFLFGDDEDDFPLNELTIKNYKKLTLPGGHHFDSKVNELVEKIKLETR